MSINDLPALSALRTRMQWHQERQRVLSENVANSDTPNFKPRDLVEPKFDSSGASAGSIGTLAKMLKSTANQMDYAAVTSLYGKSLHLLKTAIGK
jgi:flagellar basal-body rod protein FlgB